MANDEHVALLKQDVDAWNAWRKANPHICPDLAGANLSGADLSGANLSGANLSEAGLSEADLMIVEALAQLRSRSCIVDGEAVCCGDDGVPSFDRIRYRRHDADVFLYAFDLIELNGDDLRREPLEVRKATLASVLAKAAPGLRFNDHIDHDDGEVVFRHACKLGLEGIVSKRKDSPYRSGRSPDWLKMKNPNAPAVKREAEEDWSK